MKKQNVVSVIRISTNEGIRNLSAIKTGHYLLIDRIEMKNNTRLWKIQTASEVSSCSLLNLNATHLLLTDPLIYKH